MVKGYPEQVVIKQSDYDNFFRREPEGPQKQLKFDLMPERGDFIKNMAIVNPSEQRFQLKEGYDRSKYLSQVRYVGSRSFDSYGKRDTSSLMKQGGNYQMIDVLIKGARTEEYYETEQKEKNVMERLDKKCLTFSGYDKRNQIFSIYPSDYEKPGDPYDLDKVNRGTIKTTKGTGRSCYVSMKKQNQRDFKKLY